MKKYVIKECYEGKLIEVWKNYNSIEEAQEDVEFFKKIDIDFEADGNYFKAEYVSYEIVEED